MSFISTNQDVGSAIPSEAATSTDLIEIACPAPTIRVRRSAVKPRSRKPQGTPRLTTKLTQATQLDDDLLLQLGEKIKKHYLLSLRAGVVAFAHRAACGATLNQIQDDKGRGHFGHWTATYLPNISRRTIQRWQKDAKRWPEFCKVIAKHAGLNATSVSRLSPEEVLAILGEEESGNIFDRLNEADDGPHAAADRKKDKRNKRHNVIELPGEETIASEQVEWLTPQPILNAIVKLLGPIDVDPCASELAPDYVTASQRFTASDDGLAQPWQGRVFLNPGLSPSLDQWVKRAVLEVAIGSVEEVLLILPALTDADWAVELRPYPRAFLYVRPQVSVPASSASVTLAHPLMIVHISATDRTAEFADHLGEIGDVFVPFRME